MALCNKFGSLLRQTISDNSALNVKVSIFNAIRCMSTKLFVGGLSFDSDDQSLREAFSCFGDVVDAKVIMDRDTGRSKGFGFVNFSSEESARSALSAMDGQVSFRNYITSPCVTYAAVILLILPMSSLLPCRNLNGRNVRVSVAEERAPRSNFNNSGGFGGRFGGRGGNTGF
ncbi:Glycine-rich RNA-binding protein 2 [Forsythia ovata]|uniref:Glycine-rich RNA-binding protein 2 n=1 Tax=Forsythia ovata TaxID=205694 RepID=A0ABD1PID0_9LAMI